MPSTAVSCQALHRLLPVLRDLQGRAMSEVRRGWAVCGQTGDSELVACAAWQLELRCVVLAGPGVVLAQGRAHRWQLQRKPAWRVVPLPSFH